MKTKFVCFSFHDSNKLEDYFLHYSKNKGWCLNTTQLVQKFIDTQDGLHPGPLTHAKMTEALDLRIQQVYENSIIG